MKHDTDGMACLSPQRETDEQCPSLCPLQVNTIVEFALDSIMSDCMKLVHVVYKTGTQVTLWYCQYLIWLKYSLFLLCTTSKRIFYVKICTPAPLGCTRRRLQTGTLCPSGMYNKKSTNWHAVPLKVAKAYAYIQQLQATGGWRIASPFCDVRR